LLDRSKKFFFLAPLIFLLIRLAAPGLGQEISKEKEKEAKGGGDKRWGGVVLPAIFYMPETKWGGGVGGLLTYHPAHSLSEARPSSLYFYAIYTQLKQFSIQVRPELYFRNEGYFLTAKIIAETFPDKFWGLGNDTLDEAEEKFTPRTFSLEVSCQKRIWPKQNFYVGFQAFLENYKIVKLEAGKMLAKEVYTGSRGGTTTSFGAILNWDTRDNIFFPRQGHYYQLVAHISRRFLLSDFNTLSIKVDLRKYIPLLSGHTLAWQILLQAIGGEAPFKNYSKLGGDSIMRGYYSGRYRDRYLFALQGEYRLPLWKRFGLATFAGVGDVSSRLRNFRAVQFKYSFGFGLRFKIAPKEGTNLRLDFAWGKRSFGFYFTAGEAF